MNNFLLLEKIAQTEKPVIISSGMSSLDELDATVAFLKERDVDYSILQCTTSYPTKPEQFGLNVIQELKERYNVTVGFSDHSASTDPILYRFTPTSSNNSTAALLKGELINSKPTSSQCFFIPAHCSKVNSIHFQ